MTADGGANLRFTETLLDRGIIKAHEKFFVATTHTDADVDQTLAAFEAVAQAMGGVPDA